MLSCEFYEIFKNTFLHRTPLIAASVKLRIIRLFRVSKLNVLRRVRLNYATTYYDPPRPTTIHHDPPPAKICPPPPTTTHHHQLPPTTSQNISTTIHHQPKYIHHYLPFPKKWTPTPQKPKYIHI